MGVALLFWADLEKSNQWKVPRAGGIGSIVVEPAITKYVKVTRLESFNRVPWRQICSKTLVLSPPLLGAVWPLSPYPYLHQFSFKIWEQGLSSLDYDPFSLLPLKSLNWNVLEPLWPFIDYRWRQVSFPDQSLHTCSFFLIAFLEGNLNLQFWGSYVVALLQSYSLCHFWNASIQNISHKPHCF